jgi:molybdate transport repressor ModE-like protein
MHMRHRLTNIPTEVVRTLKTITETGSFSKAGKSLGLSQSAISSQIRRLQIIVGGPIFDTTASGVALTSLGQAVLNQATKLLEANDQLLSLGGSSRAGLIRVGLSIAFAEAFFRKWQNLDCNSDIQFISDQSSVLQKSLSAGLLDIACLLDPAPENCDIIETWNEHYIWVRARNFVLQPGAVIPVICSPGVSYDNPARNALDRGGLAYRVIFAGLDIQARLEAVASGIGITAIHLRQLKYPLVRARENYLPPIRPVPAGVCVRHGINRCSASPIIQSLKEIRKDEHRTDEATT